MEQSNKEQGGVQEPDDLRIDCLECDRVFILTVGERQWFEDKGLSTPKRCPDCRADRRKTREAEKVQDDIQRKVSDG